MRFFILMILLGISLWGIAQDHPDNGNENRSEFIENQGQWPNQVLFKINLGGVIMWIEKNALTIQLLDPKSLENIRKHKSANHTIEPIEATPTYSYRMEFKNANSSVKPQGINKLPYHFNYFIGEDTSQWASHVALYSEVLLKELYPGVDMHLYTQNQQIKWDFIIKAGTNSDLIQWQYRGIEKPILSQNKLLITTPFQNISEFIPSAYELDDKGVKNSVFIEYQEESSVFSFIMRDNQSNLNGLIIDPTLIFGSYSGSSADNWGCTATYDSKGFLYAGGITGAVGYPTTLGTIDNSHNGLWDVVISKFDTTGSFLVYSTYLGGNKHEIPTSLIVNSNNQLIVFGVTGSSNFPTLPSSFDASFNGGTSIATTTSLNFSQGSDLFISKFNSTGTALLGSTYLGGSGNDGLGISPTLLANYGDDIRGEVMVDKSDNIYIVSTTNSSNYPITAGVFQPTKSSLHDGVISKLDGNLSNLLWSSYLGGNGHDAIYGIKISKLQDIYIAGGTNSTNLPSTLGTFQTAYGGGGADGFLAKISKYGNQIINLTYLGTPSYDQSYFIDIDRKDYVYTFGQTQDTTQYFINNATWHSPKDGQFISKFSPNLQNQIWSTTFGNGTPGIDVVPSSFMVDLCNRVYLSAWGGSTNSDSEFVAGYTFAMPITSNAIQSNTDGSDYYIMVMTDDASSLSYGSFYGGNQSGEHVDGGTSRFDNKGRIYQTVCAGCGGSDNFPTTTGCHSTTNNSNNCNIGVFKIDFNISTVVADFIKPPLTCLPDSTHFINQSYHTSNSVMYYWNFGDGFTSTLESPKHKYSQSGLYDVQLIVYDPLSCNIRDTLVQQVMVLLGNNNNLPTKFLCPGNSVQIGINPINDPNITYHWTPATNLSNVNISNPFASPTQNTLYALAISGNQCTDTFYQWLNIYQVAANPGNDTTVCTSIITLHGSSNYSGTSFLWSSNSSFSDTLNNFPNDPNLVYPFINPLYLYFKAEIDGCWNMDSIFIDHRIILSNIAVTNPKCNSDHNGSISLQPTGGSTPYNFQWNNGANTQNINNLTAGIYSLTITDNNGCKRYLDTTLIQPDSLLSTLIPNGIPCATACIGEAFANTLGGTTPYHYQWDDSQNQTSNPAIQLCSGFYNVTITDANNCQLIKQVEIIDTSQFINFLAWANSDTVYENNSTQLNSSWINGNVHYTWTPSNTLNNSNLQNPIATPNSSTTYTVIAEDNYGCQWTANLFIYYIDILCDEPNIYVPNAFTPNNDNQNDKLFVYSSVSYELDFKVYDRWGELVFSTNNLNTGWDGKFKNQDLPSGVYVYHLKLTCYNQEIFKKKGNITLIR